MHNILSESLKRSLFFGFLYILMELFKTNVVFTYNRTDFPVIDLPTVHVIIQWAFRVLF